jgi:transposase-like protein
VGVSEWARLVRAFKRAMAAHYIAACGSSDAAARQLGMHPSDFRKARKRLRPDIPVDGIKRAR